MGRVLLGGLLGGIVVFAWGFISHVMTPIGEMGLQTIPNEEPVIAALREQIKSPGLYFYPGMDMSKTLPEAEQKAWEEKYKASHGLIVVGPPVDAVLSPKQLVTQIVTDTIGTLLIALVVSMTAVGYVGRLAASTIMGVFSWVSISLPHWNWYGFPASFTIGEGIDGIVGALLAGAVIAAIVKGKQQT